MPTYLAGQAFDLQEPPETIVKNLIMYRWNEERDGQVPAKSEIVFMTGLGWTGRKSYQISIEPFSAPMVEKMHLGPEVLLKYKDPILIHVWMQKNRDEYPPALHYITQKIEQIIFENIANVGYGITGIQLTNPFSIIESREYFDQDSGMQSSLQNQTEISLWHTQGIVELLYFKVTTGIVSTVRAFKTHKYNIEVV
jgi:hypothetical protein